MRGIIYHINRTRGMYSVKFENGSFSVIELMDLAELSKGDLVSGNFLNQGDSTLQNITTNEVVSVYIQASGCNELQAAKLTSLQ